MFRWFQHCCKWKIRHNTAHCNCETMLVIKMRVIKWGKGSLFVYVFKKYRFLLKNTGLWASKYRFVFPEVGMSAKKAIKPIYIMTDLTLNPSLVNTTVALTLILTLNPTLSPYPNLTHTPIECTVSYPQPHTDANWIRHQQLNVCNKSASFSSLKPFKNGS